MRKRNIAEVVISKEWKSEREKILECKKGSDGWVKERQIENHWKWRETCECIRI